MLRYRYVFRVEMLRYRYVFRVEMLRYRYVFRVGMLRYRFLFRVEIVLTTVLTAMKEYRQACSTGTVRIAPAECFNETKVPWLT